MMNGMKNNPCRADDNVMACTGLRIVCSSMLQSITHAPSGSVMSCHRKARAPISITSGSSRRKQETMLGVYVSYYGEYQKENNSGTYAEPKSFAHTMIETSTVVKSAHGLESLSESDDERIDKHADAGNDRHSGNGSIAIITCRYV